ncbi:MAG: class I SAM-dependent methyltransferase [Deltaproteobacteria bacterium]|nr:class I SAM-dependent methyltransferase [Deltaproteobacteria bacterium]MBW2418252.1 class I SAM-dependent methyltransferase [Deltaproteobacteria bacterium]
MLALASSLPALAQNRDRHGPPDTEAYIAQLLRADRLEMLQPERVIAKLALPEDAVVADLGCGPGVFALPLGQHLKRGMVYAVDVEPRQLDALRGRLEAEGVTNVVPVLASYSNPHLPPGRVDLVLVVDTYHHIDDRAQYFRGLRAALRPGARLVLLEYEPGDLPVGPPASHKVPTEKRMAELREAGYELEESFDSIRYHDFEVWSASGSR